MSKARDTLQRGAFFIFLLLLLLVASGALPSAYGQPTRGIEGVWFPVDSSQADALFVVDETIYRLQRGVSPCVLRPTSVRWEGRTALSVEEDTSRGNRQKWRFQLTTDGDTAIVRHNFRPILYRRNRSVRDPLENCMIDRAEPESPFADSIP